MTLFYDNQLTSLYQSNSHLIALTFSPSIGIDYYETTLNGVAIIYGITISIEDNYILYASVNGCIFSQSLLINIKNYYILADVTPENVFII